jgi:hypothetical protein
MERFTQEAMRALMVAQETAHQRNHSQIEVAHVLFALSQRAKHIASRVLWELHVNPDDILAIIGNQGNPQQVESGEKPQLSNSVKKSLQLALQEYQRMQHRVIGTEHLLLGLARLPRDETENVFQRLNVTSDKIRRITYRLIEASPAGVPRMSSNLSGLRVYISHAHADIDFCEWLITELGAFAIDSWLDVTGALEENSWDMSITSIMFHSSIMLLVLSPASLTAKHIPKERLFFESILERPIIPVLWQDCEIDPALETLGIIDLRGQREEGIAELVAAIKKHLPTVTIDV